MVNVRINLHWLQGRQRAGWPGYGRSRWQWQPTLTTHDPNPPLTLETASGTVDVTVNLTGQSSTGATGSVTVTGASSLALTGQATTNEQGTVALTGTATVSLTSQATTGLLGEETAEGTSPDVDVFLTGSATTGEIGLVALSGDALTALAGQLSTGGLGSLVITTDVIVLLAGLASTGELGDEDAYEQAIASGQWGWRDCVGWSSFRGGRGRR